MSDVEIITLIKTQLSCIGRGVDGDPYRTLTQYWRLDGTLEFQIDPKDSCGIP